MVFNFWLTVQPDGDFVASILVLRRKEPKVELPRVIGSFAYGEETSV